MSTIAELFDAHLSRYRRSALSMLGYDISWKSGEGCYLFDNDGRRYLDLCGGFAVFSLGRNNPRLRTALIDSLNAASASLVQIDCPPNAARLADALIQIAPRPLQRVTFCNSGTEAIEIAIKYARKATGRELCVHCDGSFHGLTTGSLSLNGDDPAWRQGFGELLSNISVPLNDLSALEGVLSKGNCAAFVVEPIQGKGMEAASEEFLRGAEALCRKYETLLVLDEIQCGLGRTGSMFACELAGVRPDMVTVSKALSGGFIPVGACLHSEAIHEKVFSPSTWWIQSSTFKENELAMVVGLEVLKEIRENNLCAHVAEMGAYLTAQVETLGKKHPRISGVRGRGLMLGITFNASFPEVHSKITAPLLRRFQIFLQPAPWLKLTPAFTICKEDIDQFCSALDQLCSEWQ